MAQESLWLTAACMLSVFNIGKAVDADGASIEPSGKYVSGLER